MTTVAELRELLVKVDAVADTCIARCTDPKDRDEHERWRRLKKAELEAEIAKAGYPHVGGCEYCREELLCNWCGDALATLGPGGFVERCTNGRCPDCHEKHCTPGGSTGPGHGYGKSPTKSTHRRAA
jgi:hypothetical protein